MYYETFSHMKKTLLNIDKWLDAGVAHAQTKVFDPNLYLGFRLAPDQLPFVRQILIACDTAKLGASRITGKAAPTNADTEATIDDLRARIASTVAYLNTLTEKDFEGASTRVISQPRWEGKTMTGANYFREYVVPNFYFHATNTYAILRHNGVNLGKKDYLGDLTFQPG